MIAQEIAHGDPFKTYKTAIVKADPALGTIHKAIAQANAAKRKPASKEIATDGKQKVEASQKLPYLGHMCMVFGKFHAINHAITKKDTAMDTLMLFAGKKLDVLAKTAALPTLEAYNHLFSGKRLPPQLKMMVAKEIARGNPFLVHKDLIVSLDASLAPALDALAKEAKENMDSQSAVQG